MSKISDAWKQLSLNQRQRFEQATGVQAAPLLTDAEREAIGVAIQCVEAAMAQRHPEEEDARDLLHKTSTTLSRLFDRCATGHQ